MCQAISYFLEFAHAALVTHNVFPSPPGWWTPAHPVRSRCYAFLVKTSMTPPGGVDRYGSCPPTAWSRAVDLNYVDLPSQGTFGDIFGCHNWGWGKSCYWHLMSRIQDAAPHLTTCQTALHHRVIQCKIPMVLRPRNSGLEASKLINQ